MLRGADSMGWTAGPKVKGGCPLKMGGGLVGRGRWERSGPMLGGSCCVFFRGSGPSSGEDQFHLLRRPGGQKHRHQ